MQLVLCATVFEAHVHLVTITAKQYIAGPEIHGFPAEWHLAFTNFEFTAVGKLIGHPGFVQGEIITAGVCRGVGETAGTKTHFGGEIPGLIFFLVIGI